jgi:hypothetical protein
MVAVGVAAWACEKYPKSKSTISFILLVASSYALGFSADMTTMFLIGAIPMQPIYPIITWSIIGILFWWFGAGFSTSKILGIIPFALNAFLVMMSIIIGKIHNFGTFIFLILFMILTYFRITPKSNMADG